MEYCKHCDTQVPVEGCAYTSCLICSNPIEEKTQYNFNNLYTISCKKCKSTNIIINEDNDEVCTDCLLVQQSNMISQDKEWTNNYDNSNRNVMYRCSMAKQINPHTSLGSYIEDNNTNSLFEVTVKYNDEQGKSVVKTMTKSLCSLQLNQAKSNIQQRTDTLIKDMEMLGIQTTQYPGVIKYWEKIEHAPKGDKRIALIIYCYYLLLLENQSRCTINLDKYITNKRAFNDAHKMYPRHKLDADIQKKINLSINDDNISDMFIGIIDNITTYGNLFKYKDDMVKLYHEYNDILTNGYNFTKQSIVYGIVYTIIKKNSKCNLKVDNVSPQTMKRVYNIIN